MAPRVRKIQLDPAHRKSIQTTQLLKRLQANALGELPMELTAGQVRSIEILLKKVLPDLSENNVLVNDNRDIKELSDAELTSMIRAAQAAERADETLHAPRADGETLN